MQMICGVVKRLRQLVRALPSRKLLKLWRPWAAPRPLPGQPDWGFCVNNNRERFFYPGLWPPPEGYAIENPYRA